MQLAVSSLLLVTLLDAGSAAPAQAATITAAALLSPPCPAPVSQAMPELPPYAAGPAEAAVSQHICPARVHQDAVSLYRLLYPCRRRQKRLQKLAKGKALKSKYRDMPLLGSMPPTVLGVTSEKFGDDLRQYLEGNPDHSLSSAESGMLQAGERCTMPLLGLSINLEGTSRFLEERRVR